MYTGRWGRRVQVSTSSSQLAGSAEWTTPRPLPPLNRSLSPFSSVSSLSPEPTEETRHRHATHSATIQEGSKQTTLAAAAEVLRSTGSPPEDLLTLWWRQPSFMVASAGAAAIATAERKLLNQLVRKASSVLGCSFDPLEAAGGKGG